MFRGRTCQLRFAHESCELRSQMHWVSTDQVLSLDEVFFVVQTVLVNFMQPYVKQRQVRKPLLVLS
jgi:hypothetical protein